MSYVQRMEDFETAKVNDEKNQKQKRKMIEITEATEKKKIFESCIKSLTSDIGSYTIAAENKSDLSFLAKANSFVQTLCKKKGQFQNLTVLLKN